MEIDPLVEEVSEGLGDRALVVKASMDEAPQTAMALGVMSIPALVFFRDGQEVHRIVGSVHRGVVLKAIEDHFGA